MDVLEDKRRTLEKESLISEVKKSFEERLKKNLNLTPVFAPLFVPKESGLNDNLNGVEKPISFELGGVTHEIVHSLAKWKRWYLGQLNVQPGLGLLTDMRAIRADEELTNIHSNLVDQWDWEKVIAKEERSISTLIYHAKKVYEALLKAEDYLYIEVGIQPVLPEELTIIHTEDLLQKHPNISPKEREHEIAKEFGAILLIGIGGKLSDGKEHDGRAPDYDDWSTKDKYGRPGLNADIIVWDEVRNSSLEISSMGIRVDEKALKIQLLERGCEDRVTLSFHRALLEGELPLTIGGGIGQSRVAMLLSREKNIKEVQAIF